MRKRLNVRGLFPALVVSAVVGLAGLAPAGPAINGLLTSLGYSYSYAGPWTSGPDATATAGTSMDVFIRGTDNSLFDIHFDGFTFSGATSLGGTITADAGAVTNPATGRTDVIVRGSDNHGYQKTRIGSSWGAYTLFGGTFASAPDASLRSGTPGTVDVWVAGTDMQLYHRSSADGGASFGAFEALGGRMNSSPRAVSSSPTLIDVVVRGTDLQLYHRAWNSVGGWGPWQALGGTLASAPDIASCASGHLDVFVIGTDGALYTKGYNGTTWSGYTRLGGSWNEDPSAVCRPGSNQIDVFARDGLRDLERAFEVTGS